MVLKKIKETRLMTLQENLKKTRIDKGMSQKEVADILKIDRSTYAKYESGTSEPNCTTLIEFANFFEVSLDWLLCGRTFDVSSSNLEQLLQRISKMSDETRYKLIKILDVIED